MSWVPLHIASMLGWGWEPRDRRAAVVSRHLCPPPTTPPPQQQQPTTNSRRLRWLTVACSNTVGGSISPCGQRAPKTHTALVFQDFFLFSHASHPLATVFSGNGTGGGTLQRTSSVGFPQASWGLITEEAVNGRGQGRGPKMNEQRVKTPTAAPQARRAGMSRRAAAAGAALVSVEG